MKTPETPFKTLRRSPVARAVLAAAFATAPVASLAACGTTSPSSETQAYHSLSPAQASERAAQEAEGQKADDALFRQQQVDLNELNKRGYYLQSDITAVAPDEVGDVWNVDVYRTRKYGEGWVMLDQGFSSQGAAQACVNAVNVYLASGKPVPFGVHSGVCSVSVVGIAPAPTVTP